MLALSNLIDLDSQQGSRSSKQSERWNLNSGAGLVTKIDRAMGQYIVSKQVQRPMTKH